MSPPTIDIGAPAPAFELTDADGRRVTLADFAGRWLVLYFYPRADTPGCTKEACEFTSELDAFRGLGADVLGVSPDLPPALVKFRAKYSLGVRLGSDPEKKAMTAYGAWGEKKNYGRTIVGVIRSTVIVGPDGRIAHHWKSVKAAGHAAHVKARLAALRG